MKLVIQTVTDVIKFVCVTLDIPNAKFNIYKLTYICLELLNFLYISYLINTFDNGPHGKIAGSVNSFTIIGGSPACAVDVDFIRHVPHGIGFNKICHKWLVQHAESWRQYKMHR